MGHLPFSILNNMAKNGMIPHRLHNVSAPKCVGCLFGKSHRKPWRYKNCSNKIRAIDEIKPGDNTSIDAMESTTPGLIPQTSGFLTNRRYWAATIFVDHATNYGFVHLQEDQTLQSTLQAKLAYENHASTCGVKIRKYHADNGRFADASFREEVQRCNQDLKFCGIGAHHQNRIAERRIRTLTEMCRTYLLYFIHKWPPKLRSKTISTILWPFALKHANYMFNNYQLDINNLSPTMKFCGTKISKLEIHDEHPFGCPVFVLNAKLQNNIKIPKWDERVRVGVYLGHSPNHASSIGLILNLDTGHVSPQFHVIYDDDFSTVDDLAAGSEPEKWKFLYKTQFEVEKARNCENIHKWHHISYKNEEITPPKLGTIQKSPSLSNNSSHPPNNMISKGSEGDSSTISTNNTSNGNNKSKTSSKPSSLFHSDDSGSRRSTRIREKKELFQQKLCSLFNYNPSSIPSLLSYSPYSLAAKILLHEEIVNLNGDFTFNNLNPISLNTIFNDNETYHYHEMLRQPDASEFIKAMLKEVSDHTTRNHWEIVCRSSIGDNKPLRSVWSFTRKRLPDGTLVKHKSRLCVNGTMQIYGVNYWNTYAPVVSWLAVRLMFILKILEGWYSESIDFTLVFPQAPLTIDVYVEFPTGLDPIGYHRDTHVLKLKKNLYGLKQAGYNWVEYLRTGMERRGFICSEVDQCVFLKKNCVVLVYVDDCLIFHKTKEGVNEIIKSLSEEFDITCEGCIEKYLGVEVT